MKISDPRVNPALVPDGSKPNIINGPHKEYRDLPAIKTPRGQIITRWTPSDAERQAIAEGEDIYVTLISSSHINPFFVTVGPVNWRGAEKPKEP